MVTMKKEKVTVVAVYIIKQLITTGGHYTNNHSCTSVYI